MDSFDYKEFLKNVTVCILAGGKGTRLNGADKGLFVVNNKPLVEHCINRIKDQTKNITINANRNLKKYKTYNLDVFTDLEPESIGPLGGIHSALEKINTEYICFVPCDCPLLPGDLIKRLSQPLITDNFDLSIVSVKGKYQPTFFIAKRSLNIGLKDFIANKGRKIMHWVKQTNFTSVEFSNSDEFMNLNTESEIEKFTMLIGGKSSI